MDVSYLGDNVRRTTMDCLHDGRRLPMDEEPKCPRCDGTGSFLTHDLDGCVIDMICPDCNGTGYLQRGIKRAQGAPEEDDVIPF